ncbi:MAG: sulfurtransferase [Candidatus Cloacimonetes bacterium]|jgi:thiosulfate/3-mercaptopyruvate sulfurtransferase|nr:sulfurtransferase [Candidatus Cloacimonadota bacterium]
MRMRHVMGALACMAVLMPACADAEPDRATPGELPAPAATGTLVARTGMFVDDAPPAAQLVFVGRDASIVPAGFDAGVFVPFSTFSVERNGIPNEFPAPDTMAALLHAAGVRNGRIVIVGEPIPAGRAFAAFDYLGLADDVSLYDGGIAALRERMDTAPDATDTSAAPAATGDAASLETDVREDMIVDAEWVHARLNDPQVAILDARPPAEYTGETPGEGVTRPGHIPGARNVFWQTLVESPEMPTLKSEAELRQIFREAGVDDDDTIVAYCRTGGQASFLYTVARYLGYDVKLYDGSYVDWSATDYPVEAGAGSTGTS